jgi:hypothetical protein
MLIGGNKKSLPDTRGGSLRQGIDWRTGSIMVRRYDLIMSVGELSWSSGSPSEMAIEDSDDAGDKESCDKHAYG